MLRKAGYRDGVDLGWVVEGREFGSQSCCQGWLWRESPRNNPRHRNFIDRELSDSAKRDMALVNIGEVPTEVPMSNIVPKSRHPHHHPNRRTPQQTDLIFASPEFATK